VKDFRHEKRDDQSNRIKGGGGAAEADGVFCLLKAFGIRAGGARLSRC
jgi:hypothetical protein